MFAAGAKYWASDIQQAWTSLAKASGTNLTLMLGWSCLVASSGGGIKTEMISGIHCLSQPLLHSTTAATKITLQSSQASDIILTHSLTVSRSLGWISPQYLWTSIQTWRQRPDQSQTPLTHSLSLTLNYFLILMAQMIILKQFLASEFSIWLLTNDESNDLVQYSFQSRLLSAAWHNESGPMPKSSLS